MTSAAVRAGNSSDRVMISAVVSSRVPTSADRRTRAASSSGVRALESSSCGSTPTPRSSALALPLSTVMAGPTARENARSGPATTFAVRSGAEMPRFWGSSSPTIIEKTVAISRPRATASGSAPSRPRRRARTQRGLEQGRERGLHQEAHDERRQRDADLGAGQLRREVPDGGEHPLRALVAGLDGPLDGGAVDADERELPGHEDGRAEGEEHAEAHQEPLGHRMDLSSA